jgi:rSAM/selenodomain-associated transferase 1
MNRANGLNGKSFLSSKASLSGQSSAARADNPAIETAKGCGIAFMAKASVPGRAKTRLVPPLTFEEAAALNTAFLQDVADNVLLAARDAGIAGYAAYGPPGSEDFFHDTLPPAIGLIEAWLQNFGDCLSHTIAEIFARGHACAVVLNSDSPTLPTALLVETAEVLAQPGDRAVLGPSSDGGYYLLGLKAPHRRMFEDIAWSTERVAEQTLERAREIGLEIHRLPVWYDVDDIDGLRRLRAELDGPDARLRRRDGHQLHYALHTAALLGSLWRDHDFNRRAAGLFEPEALRA